MTEPFKTKTRTEVRVEAKQSKIQNRHLTLFEGVIKLLSTPCRRSYDEISMMLVKKDGADAFAEEAISKMSQFIKSELAKTDIPILFQGEGEIPATGECYIVNVCGSRVNMIHANPNTALIFAHVRDGQATCSAIYNPITDILYASEKSKGSVSTKTRLRVSGREYIEGTVVGVFSPVTRTENEEQFINIYKALRNNSVHTRMSGSTIADILDVCAGKLDAYIGLNLSAHDVVIAELFVREAGGYTCEVNGSKIELGSTSIIACNHKYQGRLLRILK